MQIILMRNVKMYNLAEYILQMMFLKVMMLTLFRMGWRGEGCGGGAKRPPTSFSSVTSANVRISP